MKNIRPITFPYIPGSAVSGIVESVGADVTDFQAGDHIFGTVNGAYVEYSIATVHNGVILA
jgi:NADPH:quinone reductase-like Zn-dependent oxidoreductase